MAGIMPHEIQPGWVNVYRYTYDEAQHVGGFVHEERGSAENAAIALRSRKCGYRIRIVEVHDEPIWKRYGHPSPEAYAARVAFLNSCVKYGAAP